MTTRAPPPWLADFQARFGATLRTPLDRASGTLRAAPDAYDDELTAVTVRAERLAVYNRQYWFRLFEVLQAAFPLTARLLGFWRFNEHAARFLLANAPRSWDVDAAADGFARFFVEDDPPRGEHAGALVEAAQVDAAWRDVRRAPATTPFRPRAEDAARLPRGRLVPSPAVALVSETFPLVELRARVRDGDARLEVPAPLGAPRAWALVRRDQGIARLPLEAREAELFRLLGTHTVGEALATLEGACSEDERRALPDKTRAWLARSVELGFWVGLSPGRR